MNPVRNLLRLLALILMLGVGVMILIPHPAPSPPGGGSLPPLTGRIDRIVVEKSARRLTVYRAGEALRSYGLALGFAPQGDKRRQGDGKTPEGLYRIDRRNGQSRFHLSLGLDYPHSDQITRARAAGFDPGGDIMIHGQPNGFSGRPTLTYDWTAGCIALSDRDIEELWRITPTGTPVEILP